MLVSLEVKDQVRSKLLSCIDIANEHYGVDITMPRIEYKLTGTTAGTANHSTNVVDFNPILLMNNVEAYMKRTVPHEMAHLITDLIDPKAHMSFMGSKRSPHGSTWKSVMGVLGADPSRCHQYDTSQVERKSSQYEYICEGCGDTLMMGVKRHNKQQRAGLGVQPYSHQGCRRAPLTWKPKLKTAILAEKPIETVIDVKPKNTPSVKSPTGTSKKAQAIMIYNNMITCTRKEVINQYMLTGMSKACASTYYQNVKSGTWK